MIGVRKGVIGGSKYPFPVTQLLFDGDSMTAFNNNGSMLSTETWPNKLNIMLDDLTWFDFYNSAVGGHTTTQMLANVATEIDAKKSGLYARHVVFIWGGINDLYNSANNIGDSNPEAAYIRLVNYLIDRRGQGWLTVAFTITATQNPLYTELHTEIERGRQLYNSFIRNNKQDICDLLIDLEADPRIGTYASVLDTAYYQTDRIHMNNGGRQAVADIVKANLYKLPLTDTPIASTNPIPQDVTGYIVRDDSNVNALIQFVGTFSSTSVASAVNGAWRYSNSSPAYFQTTFTSCKRVKFRFIKTSLMGQMDIYINDVKVDTINGYSPITKDSEINWDSGVLAVGTKVVKIQKATTDTSTYVGLDAIYGLCNIIENTDSGWTDTGTWNNAASSTTFYRGNGSGSVCSTVGGTKTILLPNGVSRVKLFSPRFSGGGTIRMQVIRTSDDVAVYDANYNQSGSTLKAGGATGDIASLDSGVLPIVPYKVVLTCIITSCSFDAIEYE